MNLSFLSWNVGDRLPAHHVATLARRARLDLLLLAGQPAVLDSIHGTLGDRWRNLTPGGGTMILTSRSDLVSHTELTSEDELLSITRLEFPRRKPLLVAHVQMPDDRCQAMDPAVRMARVAERAWRVNRCLRDMEARGHGLRSIVVGDMKVDPFHPAVMGQRGLGAVMTCSEAKRTDSVGLSEPPPVLYNPMWGCYGDRTEGPAGTDYEAVPGESAGAWHIYNQVLLRPGLMDNLRELRILASDGREPLVTPTGLPNFAGGVYHLPVMVRLAV